jgi:hypothetical protein
MSEIPRCRTCRFWGAGLSPMNPFGLPMLEKPDPDLLAEQAAHPRPRETRVHGFCRRTPAFTTMGSIGSGLLAPEAFVQDGKPGWPVATLSPTHDSRLETRHDFGCTLHEAGPEIACSHDWFAHPPVAKAKVAAG